MTPEQINKFRQEALAKGYSQDRIDSYIKQKQQAPAPVSTTQRELDPNKLAQGVLSGKISSSDIAALQAMGVLPGLEEEDEEVDIKESKALNALNTLKTLYGKGDPSTVGGKGDLSQRTGYGLPGNILNILNQGRTLLGVLGGGKNKEDYQQFKAALESAAPLFTQALGSGTPQEGEFQRLLKSAPNIGSTNKEVETWFKQMESLLTGTPYGTTSNKNQNTSLKNSNIVTSSGNAFTIVEE